MTVSGFSFAALLCTTSALLIAAALSLRVPIFEGGKIEADVQQADAVLSQRQAEFENLRAQ